MLRAALVAGLVALCAPSAGAEEMGRSLRPLPNPALAGEPAAAPAPADAAAAAPAAIPAAAAAAAAADALITASLRPRPRPEVQLAAAATAAPEPEPKGKKKKETTSKKGSVCGVAAIKGEPIAPIKGKVKGCGLSDGVRVTSVSGVKLSTPATIDCATAKALNHWVEAVVQPAYGRKVVELRIAAHYICRTRNNQKGAKISEHGRGKAVDIAGFVLSSGKLVTVLKNYDKSMRKVHKGACGIFNTTLGPGSDGFHEDHLHFDTAGGRGPYCR